MMTLHFNFYKCRCLFLVSSLRIWDVVCPTFTIVPHIGSFSYCTVHVQRYHFIIVVLHLTKNVHVNGHTCRWKDAKVFPSDCLWLSVVLHLFMKQLYMAFMAVKYFNIISTCCVGVIWTISLLSGIMSSNLC